MFSPLCKKYKHTSNLSELYDHLYFVEKKFSVQNIEVLIHVFDKYMVKLYV